jgi:hypothetical protein
MTEVTNTSGGEVIVLHSSPTRAFEAFDLSGKSLGVMLVGDPIKPPPHYTHDLKRYYRYFGRAKARW